MKKVVLMVFLLVGLTLAAPQKRMLYIQVTDAPFLIDDVYFGIVTAGGFIGTVKTKNKSSTLIQAHSVGILFFDPFNRLIHAMEGVSVADLPVTSSTPNVAEFAFRFLNNDLAYTMVAVPLRARFEDGKIWEAKQENMHKEIEKVTGFPVTPFQFK